MPKGKSAILAGVLQIALPVGVGRLYLGDWGVGLLQFVTAFIGIGILWSILDGLGLILGSGPRRY